MLLLSARMETFANLAVVDFGNVLPSETSMMALSEYTHDQYVLMTRTQGYTLSQGDWESSGITLYACSNAPNEVWNFNMLHGSFHFDANPGMRGIVIDHLLAWRLFAREDCIGQQVTLGDELFEIVGVYRKNRGLLDLLASRDEHPAYTLASATDPAGSQLVTRCRENTAGIILSLFPEAVKRVNLDAVVRGDVLFIYLAVAGICGIMLLRWLRAQRKRLRTKEKPDIPSIIEGVVFAALFVLAICSLRVSPDPRAIPDTLANPEHIWTALRAWFITVNNEQVTGGMFYAEVKTLAGIARFVALLGWSVCLPGRRTIRSDERAG